MNSDQIIKDIEAIHQKNPDNLMARHFDADYFLSLEEGKQAQLLRIINTGLQNPESQMGAYAMNPRDYDEFAPLLAPMIRDFHSIPTGEEMKQTHDWDISSVRCDLCALDPALKDVSMRVRVARNVSTFPLPGAMSQQERVDFESLAVKAFAALIEDDDFGGRYLSITPGSDHEIDGAEYDRRVAVHQMFKDMSADRYLQAAGISADWPYGRGMYISGAEDFLVWVGEEDHLRIMSMQRGGNLNALFGRLRAGLEQLSQLLPDFATSPVYGNVTSCPTNLGTGMRASLHMELPRLTSNGQNLDFLVREAKVLGLAVRGAGGEHSAAGESGLVDISPSVRLGITEAKIMERLYGGAATLWRMEKQVK